MIISLVNDLYTWWEPGAEIGAGDGTDPFLNPEFLDFLIFIKSPTIYILKNTLFESIKGGKNMVEFGPIQMIAMGFPNQENLHGELISELFRLSDYKIIRMVGFLAIAKNQQGKIASLQLTQLSDNDRIKFSCRHRSAYWFWCSWRRRCQSWSKCWC